MKPGQEDTGDAPVPSHYSLLRNSWLKSTGVLEHWCEGETTVGSQFFGRFTSASIIKATKDITVLFFIRNRNSCKLYQRIPVNYTREFLNFVKYYVYTDKCIIGLLCLLEIFCSDKCWARYVRDVPYFYSDLNENWSTTCFNKTGAQHVLTKLPNDKFDNCYV